MSLDHDILSVKMSTSNCNKYFGYTRKLLAVMYYHAIVFGVVNFIYDSKSKSLKLSRKLFWYRIFYCFLVALVLAILIYMSVEKSERWIGAFGENQILLLVKAFNGIIFLFALAYSFLYHLVFSEKFVKLVNFVVTTNNDCFDKYTSENDQKRVFILLLLKYLTALYFIFLNFVLYYSNESGLFSIIVCLSYTSVLNVLQCTMAIVFISIVFSTKFYKILGNQLRLLLEDISSSENSEELNQRITHISVIYGRVYYIQTYAFGIHQLPIWSILVTNYISSVVRAFQLYCYLLLADLRYLKLFMASTTLIAFIFDMFFFLNVCDENVEAWKDSRDILRSFCCNGVDPQLERNVSI